MKRLLGSRKGMAVLYLLTSAGLTVLFGGMLSLFAGNFIQSCKLTFMVFFAFPVVSAALLVLTKIPEKWIVEFGAGLYYGTMAVYWITKKFGWGMPNIDRILLGVGISSLVCYIVYQNLLSKMD